ELYQHYADCDVFVLPSRYESFGLVLCEAMQFGKPLVASAAGGMAEIVEEDGNGLLFPAGDAAGLADALRRLIDAPAMRERFGRRSRELFEQKFWAAVMVRNTIAASARIAESHKPAETPPEAVAERLAVVTAEATGLPADAARRLADALLARETEAESAAEPAAAPATPTAAPPVPRRRP